VRFVVPLATTKAPSDQSHRINHIELPTTLSSTYHFVAICFLSDIAGSALKIGIYHEERVTFQLKVDDQLYVLSPVTVSVPVLCKRLLVLSAVNISFLISSISSFVMYKETVSPTSKA